MVAEEGRAAVADFGDQPAWVGGLDVEVFGGEAVGQFASLGFVTDEDQGAEIAEGIAGQVAALERRELRREFTGDAIEQRLGPTDQDRGAGGVFGLGQHVDGDVGGVGGVVGDDDHFAGAGERIDIDDAVDLFFGEGDEEVPGADDLVDGGEGVAAICHRGDGLGTAAAVDLTDPEFVAGRQHHRVVGAERGWRRDDGDFGDPRDLGGDDGHQHGRGVGGGATGDTDADAAEWQVTLGQRHAGLGGGRHVVVEDALLETLDPLADAADGGEEFRVGRGVGLGELFGGDAEGLGGEFGVIEGRCVTQQRGGPVGADVAADPFDHRGWGERFAEDADRQFAAAGGNDIAAGA